MNTTSPSCAAAGRGWPLERVLFAVGECPAWFVLPRLVGVQRRVAS